MKQRYYGPRILGATLATVALTLPLGAQQSRIPPPVTAVTVFDSLWGAFDRLYPLFRDKRIPWEAVRDAYRSRSAVAAGERELFAVLTEMLAMLNDNHVKLTGWSGILSAAGDLRFGAGPETFSPSLVRGTYLVSDITERVGGLVTFGWLRDSVGYLHINGLDDVDASATAMDEAVATFASSRGIVVDIRRNLGGDDPVGRALASRFADRPRRYMTTWLKTGAGPNDYTAPRDWHIAPGSSGGFMKPVVVLIDGLTFSAGETLLLAMRTLPHVTVVGTKTSGSMGETYNDVLPNGWAYRTVIQRIVDPEGRSWEGIGIPPDLRVANDPAEIEAGRDRALEVAMLLIGSGSQALLGRRESLQTASLTIKLPLADTLEAWIEDRGVSSAMELFNRATGDTTQWFLAEDFVYDEDLTGVGRRLIDHGDLEAAIVVLEAARSAHPESYRPHAQLARVYDLAGYEVESAAARDRALALNTRMFSADRRIAIELRGEVPASHRFFETLFDDGAGAAIAEYRRLTAVGTARVHVDPLLLVRGGQQLREAGMTEEAHTVFQFVVEEFPSWAIGYLGLAETLRSKGQTVLALEAYHTILALDPGNVYARERIAELEPRR